MGLRVAVSELLWGREGESFGEAIIGRKSVEVSILKKCLERFQTNK